MLSRSVTVTVRALADMVRMQTGGELPAAVQPDPVWQDSDGDTSAAQAAWREFGEVGLVQRPGELVGDVHELLRVLARPSVEYTGIVLTGTRRTGVVVASLGDDVVVAQRNGRVVSLSGAPHTDLPDALVRRLPAARPAPIDAINVRVDGPRERDGGAVAYLRRQRLVRQGELSVSVRDGYGRARRSGPVRFQDYRVGRVVVVVGGGYLSVAPATGALLRERLLVAYRESAGYPG